MDERKTILIVDDAEINRLLLEAIFEDDYATVLVDSAKAAFEQLESRKIDIVLLDIVMPDVDGFEVLRVMKGRAEFQDIPVVVATSEPEFEERSVVSGADDFITKPFNPVVVKKRVENILVKHVLEKEKLQNALMETENELRSLVDSVPGGIIVCRLGEQVEVQYFNDSFCELYGYSREEFQETIGRDLMTGFFEEDKEEVSRVFWEAAKENNRHDVISRIQKKDGIVRWIKISTVKFKEMEGAPILRAVAIDVTENKENELLLMKTNKEIRYTLEHDLLTGLHNRSTFLKKTDEFFAGHPKGNYMIVQFDIERFKVVNELYGNDKGDELLITVADCLRAKLSKTGFFARMGADLFVACMPHDEKLLADFCQYMEGVVGNIGLKHQITFYYGIYPVSDSSMPANLMCDRANLALRSVKGNYNCNRAIYDDKLHEKVLSQQELTNDMEWALRDRQFEVYLQPVTDLVTKKTVSAEALVRWRHPEKGMIGPGLFIPFFEHNGFIVKLDAYIREEIGKYLGEAEKSGAPCVPISVNISRLEFYDPNFCQNIYDLMKKNNLEPYKMRLEITESIYSENPQQILSAMEELQLHGFKVLMDDFGSGYSSLNMLRDVPVDILKLDMKFLDQQDRTGRGGMILKSVIQMAKALGIPAIAEGIETKEQAEFLRDMGCEYGQGYYFARPMPIDEFKEYLGTTY